MMAEMVSLPQLQTEGNMASNWLKYRRNFERYVLGYHNSKTDESKIAMLLFNGGDGLQDIFESFNLSGTEGGNLKIVLKKFDDFFLPKSNVTYERFVFFTHKQQEGESFEQYMAALRNLSKNCNFGTLADELVRDIFVVGIRDKSLQEKLMHTENLSVSSALDICRARAAVSKQIEQIQVPDIKQEKADPPIVDAIHKVRSHNKSRLKERGDNRDFSNGADRESISCKYCSFTHAFGRCPAYGKVCNLCQKKNHFAKVCMSAKKKLHSLEENYSSNESDSDHEFHAVNELVISAVDHASTFWYLVTLEICSLPVTLKVDSGASCNVMSLSQLLRLGLDPANLTRSKTLVRSFTNHKVPVVGGDGSSALIKTGYPPKPFIGANQNQGANLQTGRAKYGREGEGVYNYHPDQPQWNYQYHQNPGSSQIFTHKGNGLIPQTDRFLQQHPYPPQDSAPSNNGQQYSDQAPYYYENVPYRMYPQNPQSSKWQPIPQQQQHELSGTIVDESPLNRLDQVPFNNGPADYYYEEPYRNRGLSYPPSVKDQLKHTPLSKAQSNEVRDISNNHSNESTNTQRILIVTTSTTNAPHADKDNTNHIHHSNRKIDDLNADSNVREVLIDSVYDGQNTSPSGAILSLSLGLCLTAFMVVIVGCRLKMVRRRLRRGGKSSYAHDADYLVNGMYL